MENLLIDKNENIIKILKQCRDINEAQRVLRGKNIYLTNEEIKSIKKEFNKTFNENQILTPEQLANIAGGGLGLFAFWDTKITKYTLRRRYYNYQDIPYYRIIDTSKVDCFRHGFKSAFNL